MTEGLKNICRQAAGLQNLTLGVGDIPTLNIFSDPGLSEVTWLLPRPVSTVLNNYRLLHTFTVAVFFLLRDTQSSTGEESYGLSATAFGRAERFVIDFLGLSEELPAGIRIEPITKVSAKNLYTGCLLTFTIQMPTDSKHCYGSN
jgi:hypothetical protein